MKIAVIGGGPAGLMAATAAAQQGADVTIYEKNEKTGKKIYITGKGRCNVTNDCSNQEFLSNVVTNPKFLMSAISKWSSADTMRFFEERGLKLKVERGNRVFPLSDKASDVTKILNRELEYLHIKVLLDTPINAITIQNNTVLLHTITDIVSYDKAIIACGGNSYSKTGSNGDGYKLAKALGHTIIEPKSALSEIVLKDDVSSLEGLSLKNVNLSAFVNSKRVAEFFGEMLFTHNGVSGPIAFSLSSYINKFVTQNNKVTLSLDLKPALYVDGRKPDLDERLQRDFAKYLNKEFRNSLTDLFPERLAEYIVKRSGISPYKKVNSINAHERSNLAQLTKNLTFDVKCLADLERAIVTSGGVSVKEISPSTMQSKICPNIYFAGEVIDVDALTGGFNMQIAFATGHLAGVSASSIES